MYPHPDTARLRLTLACSLAISAMATLLAPRLVRAQEAPPPAYQLAAHQAGVPPAVLYAVALQESGMRRNGRLVAWPWTLNVAGQAGRYATRAEACAALRLAMRSVASTRIDVGLGQLNLGYQRHRYEHACDLLKPYYNLALAATILGEQKDDDGWLMAMGRYHRPAGGEAAARYRRSVERHLRRVLGSASNVELR